MGYYAGDFYAGARGDPGFLGTLFGIAKSAVGLIPGVGPIASGALSAVGEKISARAATAGAGRLGTIVKAGKGVIMRHPVLTAAGAAGAAAGAGALGERIAMHKGRGKGGGHRRRMNACNPRALRRAIRRTHAFARLAMKTIHIVHPKKKGRFGGFKKRRAK